MAGLKRQGTVMAYGCFCISDMLKDIYFSPIFPLMGSMIGEFYCWLCSSLRLIKRKALLSFMVVLFPQCGENTAFFSGFPLGWIH